MKEAVSKLCSVRRKTAELVTIRQREAFRTDQKAQVLNRKRKAKEKFEENVAKQARIAASRNNEEETATNSLCTDLEELEHQLESRQNNKGARLIFLKEQIYARIAGEHPRLHPGLGPEWRKRGGKLRVSSNNKCQSDEDYLTQLVIAMLKEDGDTLEVNNSNAQSATQDYIRALPSISLDIPIQKLWRGNRNSLSP